MGVTSFSLDCRTGRAYPLAAARLARLARAHRSDVVHAVEAIPASIAGVTGLLPGHPTATVYHWQHSLSVGAQRRLSRAAGATVDAIVACSESAASYAISEERAPERKVRVVHNGVTPLRAVERSELAQIRADLGIPPSTSVVTAVARLRPEKGLDVLIEAVGEVDQPASAVALVLAGAGPDEARLRALAGDAGAAVHFVGHQDDVAPWFALGDVVAMPSRREAFGFSAAEAMACGRPLVASSVGGLPELVEQGKTGLLVPPDDRPALAGAIRDLLAADARRLKMGRDAQARFRDRFTFDAMVDGLLQVYDEIT